MYSGQHGGMAISFSTFGLAFVIGAVVVVCHCIRGGQAIALRESRFGVYGIQSVALLPQLFVEKSFDDPNW
jgi:hypothetical protein